MENKKKVPVNTVTREVKNLAAPTGNIYESVVILYKRAGSLCRSLKDLIDFVISVKQRLALIE